MMMTDETPMIPAHQAQSPEALAQAVGVLRQGRLLVFPTETVYGLGADATQQDAVRRVFLAKGRPADHPLIVHLGYPDLAGDWAREIPPVAQVLMRTLWPGPLTVVLPRAAHVLPEVTGGQDTVALRVPAHPVALAVLRAFGGGVVAPSANRYGRVSPTQVRHVIKQQLPDVGLILDGGPCEVGLESTIVAFPDETTVDILRPGHLTPQDLRRVLLPVVPDVRITLRGVSAGAAVPALPSQPTPRVSGDRESHYAPSCQLVVWHLADAMAGGGGLLPHGVPVGILARTEAFAAHLTADGAAPVFTRVLGDAPVRWEQALFEVLHLADEVLGPSGLLCVEAPPEADPAWWAVGDRLRRAAAPRPV